MQTDLANGIDPTWAHNHTPTPPNYFTLQGRWEKIVVYTDKLRN